MWWLKFLGAIRPRRRRSIREVQPRRLNLEVLESRDVPSYVVTDLGVTPGFIGSSASALNQTGDVAGYEGTSDGTFHAFLWHNGVMTDLDTLGGNNSYAYGINDLGQVVGQSDTGQLDQFGQPISHAFLWQNGVMTDLGGFGGPSCGASAINDAGDVVGTAYTADYLAHAFLWHNGTMLDLGTLSGATTSVATGINNAGQIVGTTDTVPFLWQAGTMTPLDSLGLSNPVATAINDSGQVVGSAQLIGMWDNVVSIPLMWQGSSTTSLGTLGGWSGDFATGINNVGQVIGESDVSGYGESFPTYHPFLWQSGVMTDIANQMAAGDNPVTVQVINDAGQIAGSANGHAVLLNPVASLPSLTIGSTSLTEGNSGTVNAVFTVTLSSQMNAPVTVNYATADGTAAAGSDYQATSGTLTFAPGETTRTISVPVIGDRLAEPNETFSVNLSGATNATIANGQGVGTILDDEPRISISDVSKFEGRKGQTTLFTFTVTLSAAYDQPVTLSFRTADGTATTRDRDYVAKSGTLTFNPGETTKTITIVVNGDNKKEADETFYLDLFGNSSNALFSKNCGIGTILNDD
jgi:probable HAF family extracellular repeat protein